jgi:hypothetical protein
MGVWWYYSDELDEFLASFLLGMGLIVCSCFGSYFFLSYFDGKSFLSYFFCYSFWATFLFFYS